mmetsp:Transcript_28729/g.46516  ORF Transcript_28729/g.46516 Transcript_28729/m.46516 type:complete len:669 (-) Transcript_28729:649-2655(-)|eukprot:CAMPEP_0184348946 /NCGR_PEP_ID=MMETSP1089-20130417/32062_1 /TAXON_ID=38269 ORGANISM="Gloeochaete wittrockiana, Strain SAG46.84" /NCGR_SAMPLE_ID=MMETSP1089 /ASSEMBLY_ACC=CAM_ASM_000445 /LENGTH=668 /DNA_ID=CAMNT_0026680953 /DNA_START=52 /DNA_END=2058 /DNA_ORIENTATION=+
MGSDVAQNGNRASTVSKSGISRGAGIEILSAYILKVLDEKRRGVTRGYTHLLDQLACRDSVLVQRWLLALSRCVSSIDHQEFHELIARTFEFDFFNETDSAWEAFADFVGNLISSNLLYLSPCIDMLMLNILPRPLISPEGDQIDLDRLNVGFDRVHFLLESLLHKVPTATGPLFVALSGNFPHKREHRELQSCYADNLLRVSMYAPVLRDQIMKLLFEKMIQIDVDLRYDPIEDPEDVAIFIDGMEVEVSKIFHEGPLRKKINLAVAVDAIARKLDAIMALTFRFIEFILAHSPSDEIFKPSLKKRGKKSQADLFFDLLIQTFSETVFHVSQCRNTPFLLFLACSFKPDVYCEQFLSRCFFSKLFKDDNADEKLNLKGQLHSADSTLVTCAAYIGSFLARSSYVPIQLVSDTLLQMISWASTYVSTHDTTNDEEGEEQEPIVPDARLHTVFYAVCQSIFYILCYKFDPLCTGSSDDDEHPSTSEDCSELMKFIADAGLEDVVSSRLSPLKVCSPPIVKEFCRIMERAGTDTYARVHRESRRFSVSNNNPSLYGSSSRLDMFLPFEPLLLPESKRFIDNIYTKRQLAFGEAGTLDVTNEELPWRRQARDWFDMLQSQTNKDLLLLKQWDADLKEEEEEEDGLGNNDDVSEEDEPEALRALSTLSKMSL